MSAPNKSYDPVQVTPLNADEVQHARDEALAAIAKAGDLDALKAARLDHAGDRSPPGRLSSSSSATSVCSSRRPST